MIGAFYRIFMSGDAADEATVAERVAMNHKCLSQIDAKLGANKFFGGESMSIADFYALAFVHSFALNKGGNPAQAHVYAAMAAEFPSRSRLSRRPRAALSTRLASR